MHELFVIWLPSLVSAIAIFILSSIIHQATKWHAGDIKTLPNADAFAPLMKDLPAGEYNIPGTGMVGAWGGRHHLGGAGLVKSLVLWFVYLFAVAWLAGHIAHRVLVNPNHHDIIHTVGLSAFMGYGLALVQAPIWTPRLWWPTTKNLINALVYAFITAEIFVWLWP